MATQLRTPYIFNPIDENAQRFLCSLVDLPLIFPHARKISKPLNKPIKLYNIIGDGNCLFRALSYIITGRQIYHMTASSQFVSLPTESNRCNDLYPARNAKQNCFRITQKRSSNALNVVLYNSSPNVHSVCWQTFCSRTTEKPQACCCLTTN